ncbi:MAG: protein-disulfide reductase DsbD N-terminal domain-containing protein [Burkholderiales bacterium]
MIRALLLALALAAPAASGDDLLEPERAFQFTARALGSDALEVRFTIADGYYLYRDRFRFASDNARLGPPELPHGKPKTDQFFGTSEIYRGEVRIRIPVKKAPAEPLRLEVISQGCADVGVCYVPMESRAELRLAP